MRGVFASSFNRTTGRQNLVGKFVHVVGWFRKQGSGWEERLEYLCEARNIQCERRLVYWCEARNIHRVRRLVYFCEASNIHCVRRLGYLCEASNIRCV